MAPTVTGFRALLAGAALSLLAVGAGWAEPATSSDTDLKAQADVLFKHLLAKPNDLDAAFRFSEIETKLGDYEAAIGALERMLFYNPNTSPYSSIWTTNEAPSFWVSMLASFKAAQ